MEQNATQLTCPKCSTTIPPENINIQQTLALCPQCGAVFNFGNQEQSQTMKFKRRKAKKPETIDIVEDDTLLEMRFKSLRTRTDKLGASLMLFVMLSLWFFLSMATAEKSNGIAPIVFGLIFGGIGLIPLLLMFNRTKISLNDEQLTAVTRPISVGDVRLDRNEIVDVIYQESSATLESPVVSPRYHVYAMRYDGSKRLIFNGLQEDYAAYISQELRRRLHDEQVDLAVGNLKDTFDHSAHTEADNAYALHEQESDSLSG